MASYWTLFFAVAGIVSAEELTLEPAALIDDYVAVSQAPQQRLLGASMEVDIEAELPKLHKSGRLHGLRRIAVLGRRITYDALRFEGDGSIKNEVIGRYLTAEAELLKSEPASLSVSPANYKFKYKGLVEREGREVYVFQVRPRKKRANLFVGEIWLDPQSHLRVRESGQLVKTPSIFVRKVEFVHNYSIRDGVAIPTDSQWSLDTRLVGRANISVAYSSVLLAGDADEAGSTE